MFKQQLAEKSAQIQEDLERWAKENNILEPGEQLVFTIRVAHYPMVLAEKVLGKETLHALLQMTVEQFFTAARFRKHGVEKGNGTRARFAVLNAVDYNWTMQKFLQVYPDEESLLSIKNLGQRSLPALLKVLEPLREVGPASK